MRISDWSSDVCPSELDAMNHNMSHSVQNIALAYARSSKEASLRESSRHPKERQKARRFFVTALKTHPKQNLIRDFIERSDDAAVAYVIIQNTTEHRIEMLLAFSGRRLMDQDEAWLLERYQQ